MRDMQRLQGRIPKHLHKWLKERSKNKNRSMNGELINVLATTKAEELEKKLKEKML